MHLYCITRGIKNQVDQFITELQGKYLPFKAYGQDAQLQVSVRPIQLWEIVFPESSKDLMLATILQDGKGGQTQHKKHNKFIWGIRKALGVKPIPEYSSQVRMPISLFHTEVIGIGVKEDYWMDMSGAKVFKPTEEQKKYLTEGI